MSQCRAAVLEAGDIQSLYTQLRDSAKSPRKKRNLEVVWLVLNELSSEGSVDYSISNVGRRVESLGGPRTQSIRNRGGEHFQRLIEAFAAANGRGSTPKRTKGRSQVLDAIAKLPDMAARTLLRMVVEENRLLKHENDTLRSSYSELLVDTSSVSPPAPTASVEVIQPADSVESLSGSVLNSFKRFLSEEWLEERGLVVAPDGSITDVSASHLIAPPEFADGLRDVIRMSSEQIK